MCILLLGTVVARAAQSPTVALPDGVARVVTASTPVRQAIRAPSGPTSATATPTTPGPSPEVTTPKPAVTASTSAAALVTKGAGTFTVVPIVGGANKATGRTVYFTVEVEDGLPVDHGVFARTVRDILLDSRGWQTQDQRRFVPVSPARAKDGARVDIRVTLASPTTTDRLCYPLQTGYAHVSCWSRGRSVINLYRWVKGASTFGTDLTSYR
ncbi:MAG TPA: DUF3152 domain-containing protein, partial [Candidatus Lustribacter sp.]|nr:DUF3152 domain-containing protein [Candidatus Lustribacter sp.]